MDLETINTYNQMAQEYDDETTDFWERFPVGIIEKFAKNVSGAVLDLGSGPGRDALILQKYGLKVVCLDASKAMIEITRSKGLESIEADFLNILKPDKSFSGVWAYTSLIHAHKDDLPKALKEIHRVLEDNGTFGLGVIEGEDEGYRLSSGVNKPRWFTYFQLEEIRKLVTNAGFAEIYFLDFQPNSKKYLNFLFRKI